MSQITKSRHSFRCFAKINLSLKVLGKRPDGFHNIETLFQTIDLHDVLTIELRDTGLSMECNDQTVPTDERNLVIKAAQLFQQATGSTVNAHFTLEKFIPVAAGLGGGSSDAAATLKGLNAIHNNPLSSDQLAALALESGSDVPYFLVGGYALGEGRGEVLTPLQELPSMVILVTYPRFNVTASAAYQYFELTSEGQISDSMASGCYHMKEGTVVPRWFNDLERGVFARHPEIGNIKGLLMSHGAEKALMTGSGSSVVALFDTIEAAKEVAKNIYNGEFDIILAHSITADQFSQKFVIDQDELG